MIRLAHFRQDLLHALKTMRKQPGFAAAAVLTLALGIGANAAIFSVIYSVVLRPLPFKDSNRFVHLWSQAPSGPTRQSVSYPDFLDWQRQSKTLERMSAWVVFDGMPITIGGEAERVEGVGVFGSFFQALDVQPMLGTLFPAGSERGEPSVILSHGFWRRRFNSDAEAVGRAITIYGVNHRVVGVMPEGFRFPVQARPTDLWVTFGNVVDANSQFLRRNFRGFEVMGLLKPGVTLTQAQTEMDAIASALARQYPEDKGFTVQLTPELKNLVGDVTRPLILLFAAVGALLLIACVNVANLLLAKAASRKHEMALRAALGASRRRLWAQLLTESLVLSIGACVLGSLLALWALDSLVALIPGNLPRSNEIALDFNVLAFALIVSILAGLAFGLAPAWFASRRDLLAGLQESSRSVSEPLSGRRLRNSLVIAEIGLALMLLTGAGLLMNSFWRLIRLEPGIDASNVAFFMMNVPFNDPVRLASFSRRLQESLESVPGVRSASVLGSRPSVFGTTFDFEGKPQPVDVFTVQPGYMKTLGIPLISGRDFSSTDDDTSTEVMIVNQALAKRYFGEENPIGRSLQVRVQMTGRVLPVKEIIGVVGDTRLGTVGGLERDTRPQIYFPAAQDPLVLAYFGVFVKTEGDPLSLVPALRTAALAVDKETPMYQVIALKEMLGQSIAQDRFNTLMLAIFSGVALILAVSGLYGVLSYAVAQRTSEIGVRVALGANTLDVLKLVMMQGWRLTVAGIVVGWLGSIALRRLIEGLLFGVDATDPLTFGAAIVVLAGAASLACWFPARRATRVDPIAALRCQ